MKPDPKDVLSGKVTVDLATLVRVIHAVNPTDRVSGRDRDARYAQKSSLQSLLIRRFPASVRPVPDPNDEQVVGLQLIPGPGDAGHAVINRLDPDARQWVWAALQGEEAHGSQPAADFPESRAGADLQRGRDALKCWDYDTARTCFERALPAGEAAAALLELLVDNLALHQEALSVAPSLTQSTLARVDVRGLLALAAAHLGDVDQAIRWGTCSGAREADVHAVLAERAQARGDAEGLALHLAKVREKSPSHPEILSLQAALEALHATQRQPEEQMVLALLTEARWEEAERAASALLERWPRSEVGHRVLREVRRVEERRTLQGVLARAREVLDEDPRLCLRILHGAGRLDAEGQTLLDRAREKVHAQEEAERLARVQDLLCRDRRQGLLTWMEAPCHAEDPALGLLAHLRPGLPVYRFEQAVDAALAACEARLALGAGEPERAMQLLLPWVDLLRQTTEGKDLLARATAAVRDLRTTRASALETEVRRLQSTGCLAEAAALVEEFDPDTMEPRWRETLLGLRREIQAAVRQGDRMSTFRASLEHGRVLEAREQAFEALSEGGPWPALLEEARQEVRRAFHLQVYPPEVAWADLRHHRSVVNTFGPNLWITDAGDEVLLTDAFEHWLVIHRVGLEDGRIREVVVMRSEVAFVAPTVQVDGPRLWVLGTTHALLLRMDPWDVLALHHLVPPIPTDEMHEDSDIIGEKGEIWVASRDRSGTLRCRPLDPRRLTWERTYQGIRNIAPMPASCTTSAVFILGDGSAGMLGKASRRPIIGVQDTGGILNVAPAPDGRRVALLARSIGGFNGGEGDAILAWLGPGDNIGSAIQLPNKVRAIEHQIASLVGQGVTWIATVYENNLTMLSRIVEDETGSPRAAENMRCPRNLTLLHQAASRRAGFLVSHNGGQYVRPLGPAPPTFTEEELHPLPTIPNVFPPYPVPTACVPMEVRNELHQPGFTAGGPTPVDLDATTERLLEQSVHDPQRIAGVLLALRHEHDNRAERLEQRLLSLWPGAEVTPAAVRVALAHGAADEQAWLRALDLLEDLPTRDLPPALADHRQFLLGMALYHTGRYAECDAHWSRMGDEFHTHLRRLVHAQIAPLDALAAEEESNTVISFILAYRTALSHLAQGRPRDAILVLDGLQTWACRNMECAALHTEAWLAVEPQDATERFRQLVTLLGFLETRATETKEAPLPLGPLTWPETRLADLEARVRCWETRRSACARQPPSIAPDSHPTPHANTPAG